MRIGIGVIMLVISIVTTGEGSLVKREAPEAISTMRNSYAGAYEEGQISANLYEAIENFLEETQKRFVTEDIVEVYNSFPDDYVRRLIQYSEEEENVLGDALQEATDKVAREELKQKYNADMRYIEQELLIYGEKIKLELSEEEFEEAFPVLQEDTRRGEVNETDS